MKKRTTAHAETAHRRWPGLALALLAAAAWPVCAQQVPILVNAQNPVLDEFGQPLSSANNGDLIQFLLVNGHVYPPGIDGQPSPSNTLVYASHVGNGIIVKPATRGRFSSAITPRPGGQIIARAFNAPTLAASSFYVDSQAFTPNNEQVFYPVFSSATTNALDTADPDQDGLNNSWEKSLTSNPNNPDTDNDGMADGPEFRAGTDVTNINSVLEMVELIPAPPLNLDVSWDSVTGKQYQVETKLGDLADTSILFNAISGIISATDLVSRTTITNALTNPGSHYRVKLIEP